MSTKSGIIEDFKTHVSSGKAAFFSKYKMDFVMGERSGIFFFFMDGEKQLLNLHSNGGVFNLGHRNPALIEVLKNSLDHLDIGNHHLMSRHRSKLAKLLSQTMPGDLNYVVFGVGGGEAVDLAIKVARAFTGRQKIISANGGYHGHTGLALATGDPKYRDPFGPPSADFEQIPFGDALAMENSVTPDTAAVILETIPATLGMLIPSTEYLQQVRSVCDKNGALLILDEVQSGLGRTGKLWAFEHFEVVPDIVVIGKGLSGGLYPISATVLRQPLETVFHEDPFIHISTFGGAELGCLVAQKVLEISSDPEFLDHVNHMAALFAERTEILKKKHKGFLVGLRQKGLMMGLELSHELAGPILTKTAFDNNLLMVYANNDTRICQFLPPLIIAKNQLDDLFVKLDKALKEARKLMPLVKAQRFVKGIFR